MGGARDRIFWSTSHKAPALSIALGMAGYFPVEEVVKLRKLWSGFEGHPNRLKLLGVEFSKGFLNFVKSQNIEERGFLNEF